MERSIVNVLDSFRLSRLLPFEYTQRGVFHFVTIEIVSRWIKVFHGGLERFVSFRFDRGVCVGCKPKVR